ncbi:MAG: prefoldin subunit [archaeon]
MKDNKEIEESQRQLQILASQRQFFQQELNQIDLSIKELNKSTGKVYKSIGTFLLEDSKENIIKDLEAQKNDLSAKIDFLKKQEEKIAKRLAEQGD